MATPERIEWKPSWRALACLCLLQLFLTAVLVNVLCNGGKPRTHVEKVQR